jgi:putative ABC transport system permease protein
MNLLLKISWRNIMRHRGKSLIIGIILFVGALLMTIGNGVISGMDHGLQKNIVNSFTGDIVLVAKEQESDNVFLEFMGKAVEPLNNFKQIKDVLSSQNYIEKFVPIGKNVVMVLNEEGGMPGTTYVMGVDVKKYSEMFPDILDPLEGRLLHENETGVMVPTGARKEMFDLSGIWFKPEKDSLYTANLPKDSLLDVKSIILKDSVVLMGFNGSNTTTDIRLGIKGIVKYKALNTILGHFSLMDIESYRTCLGYFSASDQTVALSEEEKSLLNTSSENLDDLFSEDASEESFDAVSQKSENQVLSTVNSASVSVGSVDIESGTFNLVLVRLKSGEKLQVSVDKLNRLFTEKNIPTRAITWRKAMGSIGSMADIIWWALVVFVGLLFVVAIIIIVNTLSMAAIERTTEIGMMRAVGARKGFIAMMFLTETSILSFVFGGIGIIFGAIAVKLITLAHLTTTNDMIQLLYGGDTFNPMLNPLNILVTVGLLAVVTLVAAVYPILVARSITPLDAISRE